MTGFAIAFDVPTLEAVQAAIAQVEEKMAEMSKPLFGVTGIDIDQTLKHISRGNRLTFAPIH